MPKVKHRPLAMATHAKVFHQFLLASSAESGITFYNNYLELKTV